MLSIKRIFAYRHHLLWLHERFDENFKRKTGRKFLTGFKITFLFYVQDLFRCEKGKIYEPKYIF